MVSGDHGPSEGSLNEREEEKEEEATEIAESDTAQSRTGHKENWEYSWSAGLWLACWPASRGFDN